eukprot:TRINITY_DN5299_c0_g1_i7.p1 TRINITY_DN5299_c0_g1~~TRINITY_DN5299_c0_g1_i7.p1  ORF type:complete len:148 (-),score=4.43 TRINITY_DN5299_c0_g1_i7:72-515(-)
MVLLKLSRDIQFTARIQPISLPQSNTKTYNGKWARAIGWGSKITQHPWTQSIELLQVDMKVLPVNAPSCLAMTGNRPSGSDIKICAINPGKGICLGDSGGPLFVETEKGKYELIGISSYNGGCGSKVHPNVFTSVPGSLDWIERQIA